ncbi:DUF3379 domain-containing protein [Vibrio sp. SS-MA-C1-2]|uniref:DUF3379 family protein n=1 Tax=Vibrio sp. SS-MA-C1-2 TaxID=2908646 RepID=UPI001F44F336|nr:DUF3379 family protein [Vibrio sp. SS-MA-C1-2]UJF16894.1 DUF3379 domain-containing protein [Vibrio sp. SS-MA-C1-2]
MDELEFRRLILADPQNKDVESQQAIEKMLDLDPQDSKPLKHFAESTRQLDEQLADVMNVDVPDELADKILFMTAEKAETFQEKEQKKDAPSTNNVVEVNFTKKAMTIAASVAFAIGLGVGQIHWTPLLVGTAHANLADMATQHVLDEEPFVGQLDEKVTMSQINSKLEPYGFQFTKDFPHHVYFLNHCSFGDQTALHLVFEGKYGKVTLFVTKIESSDISRFEQAGMQGEIMPLNDASLIMLGDKSENLSAAMTEFTSLIESNHSVTF